MLKPLADLATLTPEEYVDWGHVESYQPAIGVGECAGVIIDLVATLLYETEEKVQWAEENFAAGAWADAIYHTYNVFINTAKAMLLTADQKPSTQIQTLNDFQKHFG